MAANTMEASKSKENDFVGQAYERVLFYFGELCKIPHGSGNEKALADYLVEFAKQHGLDWKRSPDDEVVRGKKTHNVVISKPATKGYEACAPVIMQGHIDMVCQKTPESTHDFEKDGIKIIVDGDKMTADGTTLGADDGIGVACALAVLEGGEGIHHPPIQALFTSDEEAGMTGASSVTAELLDGVENKRLINIDTEIEGTLTNACAGGLDCNFDLPVTYVSLPENYALVKIDISGLQGGHSGIEIYKGHANANKLMARVLGAIEEALLIKGNVAGSPLYLVAYVGGDKRNVITKAATATIAVPSERSTEVIDLANACCKIFREEYKDRDADVALSASVITSDKPVSVVSQEATSAFINAILRIQDGVITWLNKDTDLVETSCNLGIVRLDDKGLFFSSMIRSFYRPKKLEVARKMRKIAKRVGANFVTEGEVPEWAPAPESELVKRFEHAYQTAFGTLPTVESIHAGLECGQFANKFPNMDMIALGPTMTGVHTTEETLYLESTRKVVELLLTVLDQMNTNP